MGSGQGKARRAQAGWAQIEFGAGDEVVFAGSTPHGGELRKKYSRSLGDPNLTTSGWMNTPSKLSGSACVVTKPMRAVPGGNELLYEVKFHPKGASFVVAADELRPPLTPLRLDDLTPVIF